MTRRLLPDAVFVDTSALLALVDRRDGLHWRAKQVERTLAELDTQLVLSDAVFTEFLGATASPPLRGVALATVDAIVRSPFATVVPASRRGFQAALDLYRARPDKAWSLVDCSSIVICQERGIRRVFTADSHFRQAGFEILIR